MEKIKYLDLLAQHGVDSAHPGGFSTTKAVLHNEKFTSDMVLLDVGCGTGCTSVYVGTHYPCKVVAVDFNSQMIEKARQKFARNNLEIPLIHANAMDLPFHRNSFDVVLSESVTIFTDIRKSLREYYRVLKPGGILLATEATALQTLTKEEAKEVQSVLDISFLPTKEEWCESFRANKFRNVQVLYQRRMNLIDSFSPEIYKVFHEYANTMFRHRKKIGFGVYRCTV